VAIADGRYEISGLVGGRVRGMWTTFMLTRSPEGWRIAAIRRWLTSGGSVMPISRIVSVPFAVKYSKFPT
jgi:hypothetical protein